MKKTFFAISLIAILLQSTQIFAQDYSRKPGKISDYELKMTSYEQDTSAAAVVLYETTNISYNVSPAAGVRYPITQHKFYYIKYKVLSQEGTDIANFEIPYYHTNSLKETISGINASSYNLINGKKVETKLKKQQIFDEQMSENNRKIKFSVPNVQAGSVVEIKYTTVSNMPYTIDPIRFQHKYPLVYGYAYVAIPEYYRFNTSGQGYHSIAVSKSTSSASSQYGYSVTTGTTVKDKEQGTATITYNQEIVECVAENIPALKDENFVWYLSDYRTAINFELAGYNWPGEMYKPVGETWASINKTLKDTDFSSNLKAANPFKAEIQSILATSTNEMERITAIHRLVMSKIRWDETYRLIGPLIWGNVRSVTDKGSGSSAEINFILNSALVDAGFKTDAILLNPRQFGRLPLLKPSLDKINAFIIRVTLSDGSFVYLDGTNRFSAPNVLPSSLMVDKARIYGIDSDKDGWVNLTNLTNNIIQSRMTAQLQDDGKLSGSIDRTYLNVMSMNKRRDNFLAESEEEYIENLEEEDGIEISEYFFSDTNTKTVNEKYNFSMQARTAGNLIYLNASIFPFIGKNLLTEQERKLPIEFPYTENYIINCMISIPEGYKIEELPKATRLTACNNGVSFQYSANLNEGVLSISLIYKMNRILYSVAEYPDLREFFGMVSSISMSNIVLKKE
jgi:hypothetical protein